MACSATLRSACQPRCAAARARQPWRLMKTARATRSDDELRAACDSVSAEWQGLVDGYAGLQAGPTGGPEVRVRQDRLMVHYRALGQFLCGTTDGTRHANDIQPADFLGRDWTLPDDEMNATIRIRMPRINADIAHLSWTRALDRSALIWPVGLLVHEICWGMGEFVNTLRAEQGHCRDLFEATEAYVLDRLPPRERWAATAVDLNDPRLRPKGQRSAPAQTARQAQDASG